RRYKVETTDDNDSHSYESRQDERDSVMHNLLLGIKSSNARFDAERFPKVSLSARGNPSGAIIPIGGQRSWRRTELRNENCVTGRSAERRSLLPHDESRNVKGGPT